MTWRIRRRPSFESALSTAVVRLDACTSTQVSQLHNYARVARGKVGVHGRANEWRPLRRSTRGERGGRCPDPRGGSLGWGCHQTPISGTTEQPWTAEVLAIASSRRARIRRCSDVGTTPIVPTLGLFRPEGRPAWSATGFAGTRSEQSGSSADAAAHHVGVNDRAHDQAEHDRMQLLSLMLIGFVGCPRRVRPIDRATAPAATRPRDPYSLSLTASDCSDLLASVALAGWADSGTGRNNHDLGTIGERH